MTASSSSNQVNKRCGRRRTCPPALFLLSFPLLPTMLRLVALTLFLRALSAVSAQYANDGQRASSQFPSAPRRASLFSPTANRPWHYHRCHDSDGGCRLVDLPIRANLEQLTECGKVVVDWSNSTAIAPNAGVDWLLYGALPALSSSTSTRLTPQSPQPTQRRPPSPLPTEPSLSSKDSRSALLKPLRAGLSTTMRVRAVVFCDSRLQLMSNLPFLFFSPLAQELAFPSFSMSVTSLPCQQCNIALMLPLQAYENNTYYHGESQEFVVGASEGPSSWFVSVPLSFLSCLLTLTCV
jgi:hypothetical protein